MSAVCGVRGEVKAEECVSVRAVLGRVLACGGVRVLVMRPWCMRY